LTEGEDLIGQISDQ